MLALHLHLVVAIAAAAAGVLDTSLTWVAGGITGSQASALPATLCTPQNGVV
jgi:hypothetical protein